MREILQAIRQSRTDTTPVFNTILENAARLCNAPHSLLLMRNHADTHLELAANNSANSKFIDFIRENPHQLNGQSSLAVKTLNSATILNVADVSEIVSSNAAEQTTVATDIEQMRSLIIVPLILEQRVLGVICLYKLEISPFSEDEAAMVENFAEQAVIAIEKVRQFRELEKLNNELEEQVRSQVGELERLGKLKRFLPAAVADTIVTSGTENVLSSHRALLGALFCDIRGFTAFCEKAEPEETIEVLQSYHEEMGKLINAHRAGVDLRMGDGIMVLFNDPLPCEDPAGEAVRLALAMRACMDDLCKKWKRLGHRLGFGVGISLGYATVGMVGYEGRYDYTASGTAINLAARLCDSAKDGEILLSPRAASAVEDAFSLEVAGEMNLKGISAPTEVFRIIQ